MVRTIKNSLVAIEGVRNANTIYRWDVPTLKGEKSTNNPSASKQNT